MIKLQTDSNGEWKGFKSQPSMAYLNLYREGATNHVYEWSRIEKFDWKRHQG